MPEFDLIRRLQEIVDMPDAHAATGCVLGIGDDAAVLDVPAGQQLVICTDTLVEGVHFPVNTNPHAVGYKSLAVNLSDLAAMGAEPAWFFLSISLPGHDPAWVESFATGLAELSRKAGVVLAGGDTTQGSLCITVTAAGLVPAGSALTRCGASPRDHVYVSGEPGRAAFALQQLESRAEPEEATLRALEYPEPRLALGTALREVATACIDLSDGLAADLGHILKRSGIGAKLELAQLPRPACLSALSDENRWSLQLTGGDDYELCFTASPGAAARIDRISEDLGIPLTYIGEITQTSGLVLHRPDGGVLSTGESGYQHFS